MKDEDPHGKDPHESGAKLDGGKPRPSLILSGFSLAIKEVVRVGTFGANKYTDNGWQDVPDGQARYTDAMLRHYLDEHEVFDKDSSMFHMAQVAWNALARLELFLREDKGRMRWKEDILLGRADDMRTAFNTPRGDE